VPFVNIVVKQNPPKISLTTRDSCGLGWESGFGGVTAAGSSCDKLAIRAILGRTPMKLSIVIPAFNEEKVIETCLDSVSAALVANSTAGWASEIIVVDNNSTDKTPELARRAGARVVFEPVNQIARARNTGAKAATGDWLLFLDADTLLPAKTLVDALAEMNRADVAGGTSVLDYGDTRLSVRFFVGLCNLIIKWLKTTAGCFLFCCADAFHEIGGFDEQYFAGEDAEFGKALKRWGRGRGMRLAILHRHPPRTSDRKFRLYGLRQVLLAVTRYVFFPQRTMRDKRYLAVFYDGRR
jgi:glycosyltransferase involved in cell wall biosynthesis